MFDSEALASKKGDPNYAQVSGHVPVELDRQFRVACADQGLKISEGLEQAIATWLAQQQSQLSPGNSSVQHSPNPSENS